MKTLRIFLLILIVVGVAALVLQKSWVPKLTDWILAREGFPVAIQPETSPAQASQNNAKRAEPAGPAEPGSFLDNGRQCYSFSHEATAGEPYAVNEFLDITVNGAMVTGIKTGTEKGPDMTNGYAGRIVGRLENNTITDIYSYIVDGSQNREQEIYRAKEDKTGLEKLRYPLVEKKGILVPDKTKNFQIMQYLRVGCDTSK